MFISKYEKEEMRISVRTLQAKVKELEERIDRISSIVTKIKPPILRTAEAPWGYKMDGTPKKQPGFRPKKIQEVKNEQPVSV